MAFTYREVKDLYDVLADAGVTTKSLPEWSAEMAGVTGSDIYDAGLNDNILKRMSVGIDRGLESVPGLIEGGRSLGGGIGSLFGMEDVGREVGATLPRQAVNFLPMMIPALGPVGKVGTAFLSGIDAYTQSGSPAAGLISGVTSALLPGAANLAEQGTLSFLRNRGLAKGVDEVLLPRLVQGQNALGWMKGIGGLPVPTATEKVSELFGRNLAQRGLAEGVGQLAALGLEGVGSVASDLFDGNGVRNPFSAENLLGELIGQVPFSAMHLTGKAFSGSKSRADLLEAAVQKTERALALKEVAERANERTDIEKIPKVPRTEVDPQVMEDTNAILSKLGLEREAIKANPTTENVEQLKKIAEQEDAAVQTLIQQTNGVGLGISRRETKLDPKIAVKGTDAVFDPNLSRGEGKGFYHVTITEVPPGTRDSNGVEVKPGDRVRFPAGFYDPQENTNLASPEFLLPTSKGKPKFTVVENRPKTERPAAKAPAKTFTEEDKIAWSKGTAKKAPTLEQSKELLELKRQEVQYDFDAIAERRKELDQLEKDASSVGSSSEFLDYLARINEVRERAGYPPIDLASLQKVAVKNKIRGNINAALALVHETRNMEVAEELGKRKALEEDEHRIGVQENIYALAEDKTSPFKEEAQRILDLYHGLSEESGNRGIIATTGQFWAIVDELSKKHGVKGLAERVQGRVGKLATGEGLKKPEQAKPTHIPIFEPLSKADSATIQLIGTKVLEWLNTTTHTEENMRELKVFKDLLLEGNFEPTPDDVAFAAQENGFISEESKLEAQEFVEQYKKLGLFDQINKIREEVYRQNARPSAAPKPEQASKPYEPATESGKLLSTQLTTDGHGLVAHLQQSNDPITKALANDLLKHFPNALRMVKSSVTDAGGNLAYRGEGRDILIDFSPGMLTAAPWARENVMLHELIHGLTLHEIEGMDQDNPHNKTLTKIREKLISALPANLRKAYDAAVKSDWHNRWLDATTEEAKDALDAELHDTESGRQILYALLNNQEMAAQGFSSHSFRGYMQSVPGVNGAKTGLRAFAGWVKNLLNIGENVSATAFEEFMDATHQLMARGEYFAKLQDYGQKYFESKGVDPQYGKAQTERALGIVMESGRGISRQELASSLGMGEHQLNPTLTKARKAMEKEFEGKDSQFLASLMDESGHENLDDLVETAVAEGRDVGEVLDLLPPASAAFVFEKLRDHKEVLELLNAATKKKGTVNIAQPEKLRAPVLKTLKEIDRILEKEQEQIEMAEQLAGLDAMEPREFVQKLSKPSAAPRPEKSRTKTEELPPMEFLRKFASPLSWFAEPFTQAAQRIPELAEINTLAHQQKANANVIATQALKPFGMDMSNEAIDVVSEKSVEESQKAFGSPKLMDKINRYIALNNMTNKDKVVVLPGNHPEVQKLMNGLTPDEQAIVHDMVQKHSVSTQTLQAHVLQFMEKEVAVRGAGVIGIENGGKTKDNVVLAGELIRGLLQVRRPETQMLGDAAIKKVQARLTPEAFLNVLQYANDQAERIDLVTQYFKDNPAWSTAQAMERYHFTFLKDGKSRRGQASSIKERDLIVQKAGGKLLETKDTWKGRDDEPFVFPNMSPETARRIQEIDENAIKMMLSKGLLDEEGVAEYRKNISPAQQILREGSAAGGLPLDVMAPARKLGQGAEDLPWMWNHVAHAERTANYWTRRLLRAQRDVYLRDPELTPELQQYAKTHIDNLLQNDPIVAQGVVRTASTWFLGWNLAFNMVNGTQPLVTHAPGLTAITGKPLDSYRRIGRAVTEVLRSHKNKRFDTQEHDKFMREAQSDLQRAIGNRDEQEMLEDGVATGLKRMLKKNKPQTIGQRIAEGAGAYSRASMYLARAGENFNADIALLAAFDLYRGTINPETGVNHTYAEAKEKAYQYNQAVNFSGGRAARPVGAYSGRAPALRSAAMIGTALQSYVLGTTSTFARYIQHGFMRPKGITPQESYAARKALVQMAATQFAAAGLLGMPFVSGALALLEELFPDLEPNKNVREMVNNFLSSDAENGGAMTDMAMTGLPSMLGWDMQSRLSMGNTLPGVSEVNGFQPENLMGPAVNIVKNFVNGVTGLAAGDDKAGMNFFPPAIRKMVEAGKASLGGEGIRDFRGSPLEDATPGESVGQFLGFQPKRLSDQNVAGRIARRSDEAASRRQSQERQQMAEEVLKGNFGSVRTKLLQSTQSDKNFDPRAEVRAIARAAEELKFPRDLRREGRKGTDRGEFLRSYSNITSSPSEVARFQFRQQVAQRLGLPASSSRDLQEAQMMDQLKAQRPDATRSELRAAVQLALRRSGVQPLLEE